MSVLQKQPVPIKIGSLDTKTDPRLLPVGALTLAENMIRKKTGRLEKRDGVTALSTTNGPTSASRLAVFGDQLLTFAGAGLLTARSYSTAASKWISRGTMYNALASVADVYANAYEQTVPDSAVSGNLQLIAWEDSSASNTVVYKIVDVTTGATVVDATSIASAALPKAVSSGTNLLLFYVATGGPTLRVTRFAVPALTTTDTQVAANLNASRSYDVQARADVARVAVALHTSVPNMTVIDWNPATDSATTTTSGIAQQADKAVGWLAQDWTDTDVWCAIADGTNGVRRLQITRASFAHAGTTTCDAAATDVRNVTGFSHVSFGVPFVFYEMNNATTYKVRIKRHTSIATEYVRSVGLASKAFKVPGTTSDYAALVAYDSPTQRAYFVLVMGSQSSSWNFIPYARFLAGQGGGLTAKIGTLPSVTVSGSTAYATALRATRLEAQNGIFMSQRNPVRVSMDFSLSSFTQPKEIGGMLYLPGGILRTFEPQQNILNPSDPLRMPEAVAPIAPEQPTLTAGVGGSLTAGKTYQYVLVYTWIDSRGRLRRSAPSDPKSVGLSPSQNRVSVVAPTLRVTGIADYFIEVYRTVGDGSNFYRISGLAPGVFTIRRNDTAADELASFDDDFPDTTVETGEPLYTDKGELKNFPPPQFKVIEVTKNRIIGISAEDDREVWFSKEVQPGEGVGFHPGLMLRLVGNDGGCTALGVMDGKIVIFKAGSIYYTYGDGPDNKGGSTPYPVPEPVSGNLGCIEPESVILAPDGLLFRATALVDGVAKARGIWMLTRSLELKYIGAGVDAYNTLDVSAAVLMKDANQIRFPTAEGRTLIYDYFFGEWFTATGQAAVSAVNWRGSFVYISSGGAAQKEIAGQYNDNGAAIAQAVELAPVAATAAGGYERVYQNIIEGDYFASSTLIVKVAYDWGSTFAETLTKALGSIQVDNTYRVRVKFRKRKCEAYALRLEESSAGQGFALSAVTGIVGVRPGKGARLPAANAAT